ncbi:hypothetical protein KAU11_01805, partial [Candidatus Babeliales bacterium]|nr:hypothetical protein [Candidatus Babeliales bacterium]
MSKKFVLKELRRLPGVGKSLSNDLYDIGIRSISDLCGKHPQRLYEKLCQVKPHRKHPCVLYIFRCAVYFASAKTL